MAERTQVTKNRAKRAPEPEQSKDRKPDNAQQLKDDLDALLDEIDAVLIEDAEEFVNNYHQKGGQ